MEHAYAVPEHRPISRRAPVAFIERGGVTVSSHPVIHGITAHARHPNLALVDSVTGVARTMPNANRVAAVRPHRTFSNGIVVIPIALCKRIGRVSIPWRPGWNPDVRYCCRYRSVRERYRIMIVLGVHPPRQHELLRVIHAPRRLGPHFGSPQCREQHSRQNCDDRDDNQQFDEGESAFPGLKRKRFHNTLKSGSEVVN